MSDQELEALLQRVERSIAREIATGVDNPAVARIRKVRRKIARRFDHDPYKYSRYIRAKQEEDKAKGVVYVTREDLERMRRQDEAAESEEAAKAKGARG